MGQRGVKIKVGGVYLEYFTQDFLWEWQKKKVYVRYDPDHLEKCYVYDTDGNRFICELPLDQRLTMEWGATGEEVAEAARGMCASTPNAPKKPRRPRACRAWTSRH